MLRFALAGWVQSRAGAAFPWGTLAVNLVGCFAIGLLVPLLQERSVIGPSGRLFLLVGVLGGFTTFSTFGLETWHLIEASEWRFVIGNALGSVLGGLAAVAAGLVLGRMLA